MFEMFSQGARRVVVHAQEEARRLDHNYIGTEHILLGLLREGEGLSATVLVDLGVTLASARKQVEKAVGRGRKPPDAHIPFTPPAKKSLEFSLRESKALRQDHIGPEHILLGVLRVGKCTATEVLTGLGADPADVRRQVIDATGAG